ncbi:MAG: hypothetical protein ACRD1S_10435 [Vicinamibacterales bacterium]
MAVLLSAVIVVGVLLARAVHRRSWPDAGWPARAHLAIAWSLVVLGIVHIAATWIFFSRLSGAALWFASGGIAMSLGGSLNVLQRLYAPEAPGVSPACVAGNVAMTALAATFVALAGARVVREPQFLMLLSLLVASTALSLRVGARVNSRAPTGRRAFWSRQWRR